MFSTMSTSPMYCPKDPTLMPWLPLQIRFWTMMSVLFGLNETQSSPLLILLFWITILLLLYVSQPSVFLATFALTLAPLMEIFENTTSELFATKL